MKTRNNRSRVFLFVLVAFLCTNILSGTSQGLEIFDDELVSKPQESSSITELKAYALPPIDLYPFVFNGSNPAAWLEMDTEGCVVGRFYVHDRRTNLVTPIGKDSVSV